VNKQSACTTSAKCIISKSHRTTKTSSSRYGTASQLRAVVLRRTAMVYTRTTFRITYLLRCMGTSTPSCQRFGVSRGGIPHRDGNYVFHDRKYRVSAGPSGATTTSKRTKFHSSGFGGINNIAQPGGAKAHAAGLGLANDPDLFIPTSNLGREVPVDCP
jgi:hypothetical protein